MKKIYIYIPVIFLIVHSTSEVAFSWNVSNHEQISEIAANVSSLKLYLENNMGFDLFSKKLLGPSHNEKNPISIQEFSKDEYYTAIDWIIHGSGAEDEFFQWYHAFVFGKNMRSINHFYNPFWDNNDIYPYPDDGWGNDWNFQEGGLYDNLATGISDIDLYVGKPLSRWAYDGSKETPPNSYFKRSDDNYFSWIYARKYFYAALSGDSTELDGIGGIVGKVNMNEQERDRGFALLFRSLGQLMHLIQDAGVPEHTRNDAHPLSGRKNIKWPGFEYYAAEQNFNSSSWAIIIPWQTIVKSDNPILDFFDANRAGEGYSSTTSTGLGEFSNYQFFTKDSIVDNLMYDYCAPDCEPYGHERHRFFTHPRIDEDLITIENGHLYNIYYFWSGEVIDPVGVVEPQFYRLAKKRWHYNLLKSYGWGDYTTEDSKIFDDYLKNLVPKCIGYSAALLDYFFRGEIEISVPEGNVYSLIDGSISPQQFTYINTKLRNNTSLETDDDGNTVYETMGEGNLIAVAKYKNRTDYEEDLSTDPPSAYSREEYFSYSVSTSIEISSLDSSSATEFIFDFSDDPIPAGITDLYLQVIFKGTLGNEADNAIAVGMKDLTEPMHITESNDDDRVYLYNILRTADEIRADETLTARAVEGEIYSLIDPHNINTKIAFYSSNTAPTYYNVTYDSLEPGTYGRLILISDAEGFNILIHRESTNPLVSYNNHYQVSGGVINQMISDTEFHNTNVSSFRGVIQHIFHGHVWYYPDNIGISTAPWPEVTNAPVTATTITP